MTWFGWMIPAETAYDKLMRELTYIQAMAEAVVQEDEDGCSESYERGYD